VALALLDGASAFRSEQVKHYLGLSRAASEVAEVDLFGSTRRIDFTLFAPRGHYTDSRTLE